MKTVKVNLPQKCRIICVSDIHGHCDDFKKLLDKCSYNPDSDYLFILGDILEKGRQNIATLRYIMQLCENPKAICIKGNNDTMCRKMAFSDDKEKFISRLKKRPFNAFTEMAQTLGITNFADSFERKRSMVADAFKNEFDFIDNIPLAIDGGEHIFVHAGIENRTDWENTDDRFALTRYWYIREDSHPLDKTVVVGHFPTYNFEMGRNTNLPIIDNDKRIIDIDGGCETKWAGQLNALIIHKDGNKYEYETEFLPLVPKSTVIADVQSDCSYVYLDYEKSDLEIISNNSDFLTVRNKYDGKIGTIPTCCTAEWDGKLHGWINLNAFLSARKGDSFYVYREIGDYYFGIAGSGEVGLIRKENIK